MTDEDDGLSEPAIGDIIITGREDGSYGVAKVVNITVENGVRYRYIDVIDPVTRKTSGVIMRISLGAVY